MNFDKYCQKKAVILGSSDYYALRFARRSVQHSLIALFALRRELEEIGKETRDQNIGYTKFSWWQNEISSLIYGNPSHPVTRALALHYPSIKVEHDTLCGLISGYRMDLEKTRYLDIFNLKTYISRVGIGFSSLVARACTSKLELYKSNTWIHTVGHALMLAKFVQELGNNIRHGNIYLPINELQRYNVTIADLLNRRYSSSFNELMTFQTNRAQDALSIAKLEIPKYEHYYQRTLHTQIALAQASLIEIKRNNYQVLHQRITLTPVRKLWITWRCKMHW